MEYRKFCGVFLVFLLLGFCLYGSRMHITESTVSAITEYTKAEEAVQTEREHVEQGHTEAERADDGGPFKLTGTEPIDKELIEDSGDQADGYSLSEIECGQGQTAQVERIYDQQENRAEYRVTSDWLNYTAQLQSRESEEYEDILIVTMDLEIAQIGKPAKTQHIEWECHNDTENNILFYGVETVDMICPDFQDANKDGYLDFLVLNYHTSQEGWHTIFVWDEIHEEYVQVKIDGSEDTPRIASDPQFYDSYMEQWSIVGFYAQRFERFLWEGNELVLDEIMEAGDRYDAEHDEMKYVAETTYKSKGHRTITFGSLSFDMYSHAAYLTHVIEEEDKATFVAQDHFDVLDDGRRDVWAEATYMISKEPDLAIASYQEARQYFEDRFECRYFLSRSCPENVKVNGICALYEAKPANDTRTTYYLVKIKGEDGFYLIETSRGRWVDLSLLRNAVNAGNEYTYEYEFEVSEIECGEGYTARVEEAYFSKEHRKEYKVTSDLLNYTAKVRHQTDEEDAYTNYYTMDLGITRDGGQPKTQQIQWTCEWANTSVYPEFLDANWDGYPDLCICEIATVYNGGLCRIYVWDEKKEEYVQAAIDNPEAEDYIAADVLPIHSEDCLEQSYSLGFYEKHYQRFRWDGSAFVLIEQIIYVYDEEQNDYVEQEHYIYE